MLSVWLNLAGAPARASSALADALLDAAEQAGSRAAQGALPALLGGPMAGPDRVQVPAPAGLSPRDWRTALDLVAASGAVPAGAGVLLLSPLAGPVTPATAATFLERADRAALCLAATSLHCNQHPSWLLSLDHTAELLPSGDILSFSPPEPLDLAHCLPPAEAAYLKAGERICGSQWLPRLAEGTGAMVLCPAGLLAGQAYRKTQARPVRLEPEPGPTALLHAIFATEVTPWV